MKKTIILTIMFALVVMTGWAQRLRVGEQSSGNWRSLMQSSDGRSKGKKKASRELRGPEPDFSEEGWAMRKPRKKKK